MSFLVAETDIKGQMWQILQTSRKMDLQTTFMSDLQDNDTSGLCFKYLRATFSKDGSCVADIPQRIEAAAAAMARMSEVWNNKGIIFKTRFKPHKSLVTPICYCKTAKREPCWPKRKEIYRTTKNCSGFPTRNRKQTNWSQSCHRPGTFT